MEEYLTETKQPSGKQTIKRCCKSYLWKSASADMRIYRQKNCIGLTCNIIIAIWMITGFVLSCVALATNDLKFWYANWIVSSLIPYIVGGIFIIVTIMLYLRKSYNGAEDELFKENNPHLWESWRLEDPIIIDVDGLTASKIIRV